MENQKLAILFNKYCSGACSANEVGELLRHFNLIEQEGYLKQVIFQQLESDKASTEEISAHALRAFAQTDKALRELFDQEKREKVHSVFKKYIWTRVAAILFTILGVAYFCLVQSSKHKEDALVRINKMDIAPGGYHAVLRVAGSREIIQLNDHKEGIQVKHGQLFYKVNSRISSLVLDNQTWQQARNSSYITETPRGGQYQIVLSDGTKVWLNAASSLTYPGTFQGKTRTVSLTGEAFFQVAKNKKKPFIVQVGNVSNIVTGTSFNISAYTDDEDLTTTLLTGGLRLSRLGVNAMLKPGQQAVVSGKRIAVHHVDTNEYISWRNDEFSFENKNIETIMRNISRWYDIEVDYQGKRNDNRRFGGTYTRTKGLSPLLKHLERLSGIHFTIEGRRVKVIL